MPNLDGGHYFLTVLAPVRVDTMIDPVVGRTRSHAHILAQKLALLPTGRQTAKSPSDAWPSPFARNAQNHLARFAILEGPHFNGRLSGNSIISLLRGVNPMTAQPVDELTTPYLLFAADLDAQGADGETALANYARTLWETMKPDLVQIFDHCVGFAGVDNADAFHAYLKRCQLETTLPFNDYWAYGLNPADTALPLGPLNASAVLAGVAAAVWLLALVAHGLFAVFGVTGEAARLAARLTGWGVIVIPILIAIVALAAWALYRWVMRQGAKPFPTAPNSDLPSILKGLYLQQAFTRFAIEAQSLDDATLHARFGAFLATVSPDQAAPALAPGDCSAPLAEWAR
ncbi:MAG TPA: hypothetical protein VHY34_07810 [Caulobacteraceae bacterium]|jgi:hypothetical protein|nr:hypothetical protein [Caulobacteraceae bacterium]